MDGCRYSGGDDGKRGMSSHIAVPFKMIMHSHGGNNNVEAPIVTLLHSSPVKSILFSLDKINVSINQLL